MLTIAAFLLAVAILVAVHEAGHYWMARAFNVKVLSFSIGFGRPLLRWQSKTTGTDFLFAIFPFGGYVKMLNEQDGPVMVNERHRAFDRQTLLARASIVFAGPAANLLLAFCLYSVVSWIGTTAPASVISGPAQGSLADRAGLRSGDRVMAVAIGSDDLQDVDTFTDLHYAVARSVVANKDMRLVIRRAHGDARLEIGLPISSLAARELDPETLQRIGFTGPYSRPIMGEINQDSPAQAAGLIPGDWVRAVDGVTVSDAQTLRRWIRQSAATGVAKPSTWRVMRDGNELDLVVTPQVRKEGSQQIGKVGAVIGSPPEMVDQKSSLRDGLVHGLHRTVDAAWLTLQMILRMLLGEASLGNLSGPLTIADYAGKTAAIGVVQYLTFLALISVSLGVLNLLPLPLLDGGHLMYYLWEAMTGRPIPDAVMSHLQRGGWGFLMVIFMIALFNDVTRLLG